MWRNRLQSMKQKTNLDLPSCYSTKICFTTRFPAFRQYETIYVSLLNTENLSPEYDDKKTRNENGDPCVLWWDLVDYTRCTISHF